MVPVFLPVCAAAAAYPQVRFPNPEAACSILDNKINFLQVKRQIVAQRKFLQGRNIANGTLCRLVPPRGPTMKLDTSAALVSREEKKFNLRTKTGR
jgi:hypothetical protein